MTKTYLNVVVAGGGTAGHIEPALAVASVLKQRGSNVIALGTNRGLETRLVPARGFELKLINPVPVPRSINGDLFKLPFRLIKSIAQTRKILKEHDADILIGFGGYVAAPGYLAAKMVGIPFIVHEANARAGMANKLGVKLGGLGLNAVKNSGMQGRVVGIPIRASISEAAQSAEARERAVTTWGLDPNRKTVFVTGGSQGAASLNAAVENAAADLVAAGFQILHAFGAKNEPPTPREHHCAVPYIEDMAAAYAVADLIVCRSGAMSVAEVTAAGLPAVYVPLPHGNGEQGLNAEEVVEQGAALLINDAEIEARFPHVVSNLLGDDAALAKMKQAAISSKAGNAAEVIADIVDEITAT
ncbi:MAG: undecaprenyldiphospho-muramoylpentapeptide beta-N-acetylglucosaminyltransferase [Corynebacterium sp.]|uniref:undecaprenyldiphospho-muramoylpentapeptide beta-N-acetylglucosaminyltransferase n=1 Tax=Corynebacterium sp. TaxID=1720 RepID=UPI0026DAEA01|nr:undecaprenyldiphospho-muramoylpentapeptide beta-N-acetylglucosaminyltransferase [Corynebacterium sp.]MDO5097924.1 undecaprenyldiphospho-muramoylpentapeptide beta-N-acetylglucosaminyltransferase [Corynebacterium sp.]